MFARKGLFSSIGRAGAVATVVAMALTAAGETVFRIGAIEAGPRGCTVTGARGPWAAREDWRAVHDG